MMGMVVSGQMTAHSVLSCRNDRRDRSGRSRNLTDLQQSGTEHLLPGYCRVGLVIEQSSSYMCLLYARLNQLK